MAHRNARDPLLYTGRGARTPHEGQRPQKRSPNVFTERPTSSGGTENPDSTSSAGYAGLGPDRRPGDRVSSEIF